MSKREPYGSKIKAKREQQEKEVQEILNRIRTPETLQRIKEILNDTRG